MMLDAFLFPYLAYCYNEWLPLTPMSDQDRISPLKADK